MANESFKSDEDIELTDDDAHSLGGSPVRIRIPDNPHLDAIQGNPPPPSINIDSEHAPAHTRSNSHSSAASIRSISDRGETLYERYHPNRSSSFIQPPKSGKSEDLQIALYAQQVSMKGGKHDLYKCFFPKGSLDQLITPQIVYESISESTEKDKVRNMDPEEIHQYAEKVCGSAGPNSSTKSFKKMFAVLLLADAPGLIVDFVDEDLNDSDLPLILDTSSNHRSIQRHLYRKARPGEPIQCLESWSIPGRTSFYSYQWTTIAPFFASAARAQGIKVYKLSDEDILPWTKKYDLRAYGGYSEVYRVAIHGNHHDFGDRKDSDGTFAVKKLRYEEADSNQSGTSAAPSQARKEHSLHQSVIKLTDFGLARFHSETSRSGIRQSKIAGFTPSYRPPELDLEGILTISRSFDIWSLGCVFLEFVTWYFGGWAYLHESVVKRMRKDIISGHKTDQFFEFVQNENTDEYGLRIKLEVLEWISELHMRADCSDLMHDVLDFIEKRMLAVIPPSKSTKQPNTRANIEEVLANFRSFKDSASKADYPLEGHSKTTYIDRSAISVDMTSDTLKKDGLRKDRFEVLRGDQEYKVTTRRTQTGF